MSEWDCHLENPGLRKCKPKLKKLPQIALLLRLVGCLLHFLIFSLILNRYLFFWNWFMWERRLFLMYVSTGMHKLWVTIIFPLAMLFVKDELVTECHWWLYLPIILKCWFCKFRSWRTVKLYAVCERTQVYDLDF